MPKGTKLSHKQNLTQAFKWLLTNPDPSYKSYFRPSYRAFAIAEDKQIAALASELGKGNYEPEPAVKILNAKPSGLLRPITLLSVKDQIVYQAFANNVAEKLHARTKQKYNKTIFSHQYGGNNSRFFYKKWKVGWQKYQTKIKEKMAQANIFFATFDLTAFYDSIDHSILSYFLKDIGINNDDLIFLEQCLKKWTASQNLGYHADFELRQGIPQGPNASGIFSEVVLQHLDKIADNSRNLTYLRYVDDIFIASRSKNIVQNALISLDVASKEIGLFPQNTKINSNISRRENIKSQSFTPSTPFVELSTFRLETNDNKRIGSLIRAGVRESDNASEIKNLILNAKPSYKLNAPIIDLLNNYPDFSPIIAQYLFRYSSIPAVLSRSISDFILTENPYQNNVADIISSSFSSIESTSANKILKFIESVLENDKWNGSSIEPRLKVTLVKIALKAGRLGYQDFKNIMSNTDDWWTISELLYEWDVSRFGRPTVSEELNHCLKSDYSQVALAAAERCIENEIAPHPKDIENSAVILLKDFGLVDRHYRSASRISKLFGEFLEADIPDFSWRAFLSDHDRSESQLAKLNGDYRTDPDRFILGLDSWFDACFHVIWEHFKPSKQYPNYGHALKDTTIGTALPSTVEALLELHNLRCRSYTAHPRDKAGRPTKRLKYSDFKAVRLKLVKALKETIHHFSQA